MKPAMRNLFLVGIALIVGSFALPAPLALAKKKPELVITQARLTGKSYAFKDDPPAFLAFEDVTKNAGKGSAGRSSTELVITHGNIEERIGSRPVPQLGPGKKDSGEKLIRWPGAKGLPAGAYRLFVCADASKKVQIDRHCRRLRGKFIITKKTWDGFVGGAGDWPLNDGARETWDAKDAKFTFTNYAGGGTFLFKMSGTVVFKDSGTTSGGCVYSGNYVLGNPEGTLTLDYLSEKYVGIAVTSPNLYPVQTTCGDVTGPTFYNYFSASAPDGSGLPLPFGTDRLQGSATIADTATGLWDLQ
jgi:hypothetical protein